MFEEGGAAMATAANGMMPTVSGAAMGAEVIVLIVVAVAMELVRDVLPTLEVLGAAAPPFDKKTSKISSAGDGSSLDPERKGAF